MGNTLPLVFLPALSEKVVIAIILTPMPTGVGTVITTLGFLDTLYIYYVIAMEA